jgi:predicted permease
VLAFRVSLPSARYPTPERQDQLFAALHERLRAIPGVTGTATVGVIPLHGSAGTAIDIQGRAHPGGRLPEAGYVPASDDYFRVMEIPLVRGRAFDSRDVEAATSAVILSESLARQLWPGEDPIGARVRVGPDSSQPWGVVVGIVGDVRQQVLGDPRPTVYTSSRQDHWGSASVIVRVACAEGGGDDSCDPRRLLPAVRRELAAIDPALPVMQPTTFDATRDWVLTDRRLPMQLLSGFALLALVLAAIGVYGVMAYAVASRTREFGVRMALGARRADVLSMVMGQGVRATLIGVALGLAGAAGATRLLAGLLYGVRPLDPGTFIGVSVLLLVVAVGASLIPARRATAVDPVVALRAE